VVCLLEGLDCLPKLAGQLLDPPIEGVLWGLVFGLDSIATIPITETVPPRLQTRTISRMRARDPGSGTSTLVWGKAQMLEEGLLELGAEPPGP